MQVSSAAAAKPPKATKASAETTLRGNARNFKDYCRLQVTLDTHG
jgi:hypothetical protein